MRVVFADAITKKIEERWRGYLKGLPLDLVFRGDADSVDAQQISRDADVIVARSVPISASLLQSAGPRLRLVVRLSRWDLGIDLRACARSGVEVRLVPQLRAITVAEHAMALLLACARKLILAHAGVKEGKYRELGLVPQTTTEHTFSFKWLPVGAEEVCGKTLGILGLGEIGRELALRARAFGMSVVYADQQPLPRAYEEALGAEHYTLEELLRVSDFVSVHVPHTPATEKMVGRKELGAMKRSAYLINVARGGIVDEGELVLALREGRIAGAGLDVFAVEPLPSDSPLLLLDNVVLTPHIGGGSGAAWVAMGGDVRRIMETHIGVEGPGAGE